MVWSPLALTMGALGRHSGPVFLVVIVDARVQEDFPPVVHWTMPAMSRHPQ
jgi:hypothetical protein